MIRQTETPSAFPAALRVALVLSVVLLAASCGRSPTDAYYGMVAAAKMGDRETFLNTFTKDSRHLIEALLELSDIYGLKRRDPYKLLVHTDVVSEEPGKPEKKPGMKEARAVTYLTVKVGHGRRKIKMVQDDGEWKIDAFDLEQFWQERANFRIR